MSLVHLKHKSLALKLDRLAELHLWCHNNNNTNKKIFREIKGHLCLNALHMTFSMCGG